MKKATYITIFIIITAFGLIQWGRVNYLENMTEELNEALMFEFNYVNKINDFNKTISDLYENQKNLNVSLIKGNISKTTLRVDELKNLVDKFNNQAKELQTLKSRRHDLYKSFKYATVVKN